MFGAAMIVLTTYATTVILLQRRLVFPRAFEGATRTNAPTGAIELSTAIPEGAARAWLFPAKARSPLLVFFHGNGERIQDLAPVVREYVTRGFSVLTPEYRGYGQSDGRPSSNEILRDLEALVALAKGHESVDGQRTVFHGFSLGGGFAMALAARVAPNAMILESTFRSIPHVARRFLVPRFLILDELDSERTLEDLNIPVLVIHGTEDQLIPSDHGVALSKAARGALQLLPGGHGSVPHDTAYEAVVSEFLRASGLPHARL